MDNSAPDVPKGEGKELLADPHHKRADLRLAARIISLGCVPEETAAAVLQGAFTIAAQAVKERKARDYAAAMSVPIAVARLELEREKMNSPQQPGVVVNIQNNSFAGLTLEQKKAVLEEKRAQLALHRALNGQLHDHDPDTHGTATAPG